MAVLEPNPLLLEAIVRVLSDAGDTRVLAAGEHLEQLLASLHRRSPDVVLVDVGADRMDRAVEWAGDLLERPALLLLADVGREDDRRLSLALIGDAAVGALRKDSRPADLIRGVLQAANGQAFLPRDWMRTLHTDTDRRVQLTPRQQEILDLLAQGLTNRQIADRLYLSINTVKYHVKTIYGALGVQSRVRAAAFARRN